MEFTEAERARHLYIVGKTGSGKSTLLSNLALADIASGHGVCFIDFHGDEAEALIDAIPKPRTNDVCYFDLSDDDYSIAFNPLAGVGVPEQPRMAANLVHAMRDVWKDSWGAALEWQLNRGIALLLEKQTASFRDLSRLFYDKAFQARMKVEIDDEMTHEFWHKEYPGYGDRYQKDRMPPLLNKVGQFIAHPKIRSILDCRTPLLSIPELIARRQILIVNLDKGRIGKEPASLLAALIVAAIRSAAFSSPNRKVFHLFIDEFQNAGTVSFAELLSEARKYQLTMTLAHQFISQLIPEVRDAILGNVGTVVAFRVGVNDAPILAAHLGLDPLVEYYGTGADVMKPEQHLLQLEPFRAWVRSLDNQTRKVEMAPPIERRNRYEAVVAASRRKFARKNSRSY